MTFSELVLHSPQRIFQVPPHAADPVAPDAPPQVPPPAAPPAAGGPPGDRRLTIFTEDNLPLHVLEAQLCW